MNPIVEEQKDIMDMNLVRPPGCLLRRAATTVTTQLELRLAVCDLNLSEASVLLLLGDCGEMTASAIGSALRILRTNMVVLLRRLEARGLIDRAPIDRKSQAIALTKQGRERLATVREVAGRFDEELAMRIPAAHRDHFRAALHSLSP